MIRVNSRYLFIPLCQVGFPALQPYQLKLVILKIVLLPPTPSNTLPVIFINKQEIRRSRVEIKNMGRNSYRHVASACYADDVIKQG